MPLAGEEQTEMDPWRIIDLLCAGFCAVLWWNFRRAMQKVDNCVTKEDLQQVLTRQDEVYRMQRELREAQHQENRGDLRDMRQSIADDLREIFGKLDDSQKSTQTLSGTVGRLEERVAHLDRRAGR